MTTIPAENLLVSRAGLLAGPGMNVQTQGPTQAGAPTNPEEQGTLTTTPLTVEVANVTLGTQPVRAQVTAQQNPIGNTAQPDASDQFIAHMGTYSKHTKQLQKDH